MGCAKVMHKAHVAVRTAIEKGHLPVLDGSIPCQLCDSPANVYDHRDYQYPLFVRPLCYRCNSTAPKAQGWLPAPTTRCLRMTINASRKETVALFGAFRKLVGERGINRTLKQLIEAWVKAQESQGTGR